jgi:oligopeptide transport system ATP-binding protein
VNGVNFSVKEGEILGIVGESGCGKSVTLLSILGLIPRNQGKVESGSALFSGKDLLQMHKNDIRKVRGGQIGMVFQDPMTSLNPLLNIETQLSEAPILHQKTNNRFSRKYCIDLLQQVGIPEPTSRIFDYPHHFSGGMCQRVMIAMAISCEPKLLIADEPTTALDVTVQAQIIDLIKNLRKKIGMSVIWITHDLGVIADLAQKVLVMYSGYVVEEAPVQVIFQAPKHPYTRGLLGSTPKKGSKRTDRLINIEGTPPDGFTSNTGCPFTPRCKYSFNKCFEENPTLKKINSNHKIACWWDIDKNKKSYE